MKSLRSAYALLAILMTIFISSSGHVCAQIEKTLRFEPETLDFGTIRETDGPVSKTVKAINISPDSTFIISARTSCGCSAAEFDGKMMSPGDSTTVTITYDPTNRPGKFQKTAKIFTGKERFSNLFHIKGTVIPSKRHLDKSYPDIVGTLRFSTLVVNAGEMKHSERKPLFIGIYNDSDKPITLSADTDSDALEASIQPDKIMPYEIATLSMIIKGAKFSDKSTDFNLNATIINAETGEEIVKIPVGGILK